MTERGRLQEVRGPLVGQTDTTLVLIDVVRELNELIRRENERSGYNVSSGRKSDGGE